MTEKTYNAVQSCYGNIAKNTTQDDSQEKIATAFGYSASDLASLPEKTNLGVSCGNPVAYANMKEGETVVDLGSGGGIDVFLAARKVGPTGKAIGIDMTNDMIELANKNAKSSGLSNTSFIQASITSIPLPDSSVDCIISNCVINLVPKSDKPTVFQEIARILKPGGRVAVSDILARKELPCSIVNDMALYVGCVAGASQIAEYEEYLQRAGFEGVFIVDAKSDLNLYKECSNLNQNTSCCATPASGMSSANSSLDFNEWAAAGSAGPGQSLLIADQGVKASGYGHPVSIEKFNFDGSGNWTPVDSLTEDEYEECLNKATSYVW